MLPKKERLSREMFNRFFATGKRIHSPSLQMIYTPYNTLHVSVVVSKKNYKSAVKRNKIRRRIYDIVRRYRAEKPLTGIYIFITKSDIHTKTYSALHDEVCLSLQKIKQ